MTEKQAKKLTPDKDYVHFAGKNYMVAGFKSLFGVLFIGIYDERPHSDHVDYIKASSVKSKCDIDTVEGAAAYFESQGVDIDECVKMGRKVIKQIK